VILSLDAQMVTTGKIALTSGAEGTAGSAGVTPSGANPPYDGKGGQGSVGGAGGMVRFSARRLTAPSLHLLRQNGALDFRVETLDVRSQNTTVILEHTRADEVDFGRIHLGGGQTLDMNRAAPTAYRFTALEAEGEHTAFIAGDMDIRNRALVFTPSPTLTEGETLLRISGAVDVDGANVDLPELIGLQGGRSQRDMLSLLAAGSLKGMPNNEGMQVKGLQGVSIVYDYALKTSPQQGTMRLDAVSSKAAPQSKALSEGFLSGLALLNQGADLAADKGMRLAQDSARRQTGHNVFAALSGGSLRQRSGSHIDLDSTTLIVGVSAGMRFATGRLTAGAFVEYGRGDYETDNRFGAADQALSLANAWHVRGRGDSRYAGGGALAHYATDSGYYAEASLRAGRLKTRFSSADLQDYLGRRARYDLAAPYYGAHVGAGYLLTWREGTLDLYGKYFWMRRQGERATLSTGDDLRFEAGQSERLRAGLRLSQPLTSIWKSYAGLAYEHEFDGKARAATRTHARAYAIDAPRLRGDSGMIEIGLSAQQGKGAPLSFDLGLQGYTGRRKGVIGSVHMDWAF
jgi:outer membrane autotransporter protein